MPIQKNNLIAAGGYHTLAIKKGGLFACGSNDSGQCGINTQGKDIYTFKLIVKPEELIFPNEKKKNELKERFEYLREGKLGSVDSYF